MRISSTAKTIISIRGSHVTYGSIRLIPVIEASPHGLDISASDYQIVRDGELYPIDMFPLALALPKTARNNIIIRTFEADEDERLERYPLEFLIPEYDEALTINFRAALHADIPDAVALNVEDDSGDWLPIEDVTLAQVLSPSFMAILERATIDQLDTHNMDRLPIFEDE